jgi:subtilase family serine protease
LTTAGFAFSLPLAAPGATPDRVLGHASAADQVEFAVHLPLRNSAELDALMVSQTAPASPFYHHWLTPEQFRASFGPAPATVRALLAALRAQGLAAAQTSTQMLTVRGAAPTVERFFATKLTRLADARTGRVRVAATGRYSMPALFAGSGAVVLKLHATHPLKPAFRALGVISNGVPANRYGPFGPYWATDLKQALQFPSYKTVSGKGVNVAIVDGGDFSETDLTLYLQHELIGSLAGDLAPRPQTRHVRLPGAPGFSPSSGDSFEANLDAQQVAMTAPGATLTAFITADDTDASFIDADTRIVESNKYDIVSTSYGECELAYTAPFNKGVDQTGILTAYNDLYKQGNAQGTTFIYSSGDEGGLGCPEAGYFNNPPTNPPTVYQSVPGVSANASLPTVIGVGGGELETKSVAGSLSSVYSSEDGNSDPLPLDDPYGTGNLVVEFFGAGGGKSVIFTKPSFQSLVDTGSTMRTVPDVGGHIGRYTATGSYDIEYFAGQETGVLGTSASAPDFAGLLALKVQSGHSRLGLENTDIYTLASHNYGQSYQYFHDNIPGNDQVYSYSVKHRGYNYIYGVGSVRGAAFLGLPFTAFANDPQTASNP